MKKYAVITGVASGIGKAIAESLSNKNDIEVLGIDKNKMVLPKVKCFRCNLSNESEIIDCVEKIKAITRKIDILVNVAGIFCYEGRYKIENLPVMEWNEVLDANLKSTFLLTKHMIPFLRESKNGIIINFSSDQVVKPQIKSAPYAVSKAAIEMFSKIAALELLKDKIRVNTIALASVRTNFLKSYIKNDEMIEKMMVESNQAMPFGLIETEDVNEIVKYLINENNKMTGQTILIDSGTVLTLKRK